MRTYDVLIVGSGIVGLSVARAMIELHPTLKILVCEKESDTGAHASGRNSGVLHAGFYYSPDSLKAKFCKEGNLKLKKFIEEKGIPILQCGKVVVTSNETDERRLQDLYDRGIKNKIDVKLLPANDLRQFEPLAQTWENFLWSPTTAVSDPKKVIDAMKQELASQGVEFAFLAEFSLLANGAALVGETEVRFRHLVNAAGSQADRIAHQFDLALDFAMLPFIGLYRFIESSKIPLKTLVYPVPNPKNPFLGTHFTLTVDGKVKIGPTAIPILGREQYKIFGKISVKDFQTSLIAALALARGSNQSISKIAIEEFPKYFERILVRQASKLVPSAITTIGWKFKDPGIRSQLVDLRSGKLVDDFLVEGNSNSTHILNAVSPGWTSAIPFGEFVAMKVIAKL
jgi:L-2-hydroxyglutarate oxidase